MVYSPGSSFNGFPLHRLRVPSLDLNTAPWMEGDSVFEKGWFHWFRSHLYRDPEGPINSDDIEVLCSYLKQIQSLQKKWIEAGRMGFVTLVSVVSGPFLRTIHPLIHVFVD